MRVLMLDLLSIVPYYTGHLCASLERENGLEVRLASIRYHHDPDCFRRQGVRNDPGLLDLPSRFGDFAAPIRRLLKVAAYLVNLAALMIRFMRSKPDIIHVQFLPLASYGLPLETWFLRVARAIGIKVVYTVHNILPHDSGRRRQATYRNIYRLSNRLICHDAEAASKITSGFAVKPERISIIPHGPLFHPAGETSPEAARRRLRFPDDECIVLCQGILRPYKGVPFLLDAWRQVVNRISGTRLAIVGVGEEDQVRAVVEQVSKLELENHVRLELRFVSLDELTDFYSAADILVYPYSAITTSGALMTGIGYGKAIVASALPAFERILHDGENALLVPYGKVDVLAERLERLIGCGELRRRLAGGLKRAPAAISGWGEIAAQTHDCYRTALSA